MANKTNVVIVCNVRAYTIEGTIYGLNAGGGLVLKNGNDFIVVAGQTGAIPFIFQTPVAYNSSYSVSVVAQPSGQFCTVSNGSGTALQPIYNVLVNCINGLTTNLSDLALSVTNLTEYGVSGPPQSGKPRIIRITNTGSSTGINLWISYPVWPKDTTATSTCTNTLGANATCTITPGGTATNQCTAGKAPVPGRIVVSTDNLGRVTTDVVVLGYGCIYQGGLVYALDDTTPDTRSVGDKVMTAFDLAPPFPAGIIWSSNGAGGDSANVDTSNIPGIYENSTSPCVGNQDGACNSARILAHYSPTSTYPLNYYAAGLCVGNINQHSDWYLPAIYEMGYDTPVYGTGCGTSSAPTLQNMQSNLVDTSVRGAPADFYWSSTECSGRPQTDAWYQYFASGGGSFQGFTFKDDQSEALCSRALSF